MSAGEDDYRENFWKNLPKSIDYFAPAIQSVQDYTGIDTAMLLKNIGKTLGEKFSAMNASLNLEDFVKELSKLWERSEVGRLHMESVDPLVLYTSNCAICGQLPEMGGQFRCAFHEGFFEGVFASKLNRPVNIKQEVTFRADAGTWSRKYTIE